MPRRCRFLPRLKRSGRAWLAGLLVALLCSQSIGLLHRIVHATAIERPARPDTAARDGAPAVPPQRWFAGHAALHSVCLVFDQISHSSPLPATPNAAGATPPAALARAAVVTGRLSGTTRVPFDARGPPLQS